MTWTAATTRRWMGAGCLIAALLMWQVWTGLALGGAAGTLPAASPVASGTPAAAASPVASPVPTAALGEPVPYGDDWIFTAIDASLTPLTPFATPQGTFAIVAVTIENTDAAPRGFPFDDLRLEADGDLYAPDFGATNTTGAGYFQQFPPTEPQETAVVFDIAAGVTGSLVLQSATDGNFRILVRQAGPSVASPVASPAPVTLGQPVPYGDGWIITATDVSLEQRSGGQTPQGIFVVVTITVENTRATPRTFPFGDLRLESAGTVYAPDLDATNTTGTGRYQRFPPADPEETAIVFDLPASALGPFLLQSASDPEFQILIDLPRRG